MGRRIVFDAPAAELAEDLRCVGRVDLHRRLTEALQGFPLTDDHVAEVTDRLVEISNDLLVPERDRHRAQELAEVADDLLSAIGRGGYVHMTWRPIPNDEVSCTEKQSRVMSESDGIYQDSWGGEESYETSPKFTALGEALEWARARAPWVVVRPWWDAGTEYWAGDNPVPGSVPTPTTVN